MKTTNKIVPLILLIVLTSCIGPKATSTQPISTITSSNYDEKTNFTTYSKLPFGSISMPGEWTKSSYNQNSRQQFFKNEDDVSTAIAINKASSYSFYNSNMNSNQIVKEFYEWDSKYLADNIQGSRSIIKIDNDNHFIIWKLVANNEQHNLNNYYLFGSENGIIFNLYVATDDWTEEQKIEYLVRAYNNRKVGR